ncbi:hypothetical protein SH668x_003791 [Planctomicrobium sp. SH668]|uniref:hypothetical protein n=1 Tax=Planctomicrobium sp. SH668 TaxID=3448126 RepID=UPI003F5C4A71
MSKPETDVVIEQNATKPKRKASRLGFWFLMLFVIVCGTLFCLPLIASQLCRSPEFISMISGQPAGTVAIGNAAFGWQAPMQLTDVSFKDESGSPVVSVKSVTYQRTFWELLTGKSSHLKLDLDGLQLKIAVPAPGTSSNEKLDLSESLNMANETKIPSAPQPMELNLTNCSIEFQNAERQPVESWKGITAYYRLNKTDESTQEVRVSVPADPATSQGPIQLQALWTKKADAEGTETLQIEGGGQQVSLIAANLWLEKYLGKDHGLETCTGSLQGEFLRNVSHGWKAKAKLRLQDKPDQSPVQQVAFLQNPPGSVDLEVDGEYSKPADELSISRLYLSAANAAVDLKGKVSQVSGPQILNVLANVRAPGTAIIDLLPAEIREKVEIEGIQLSQVTVDGALAPKEGEPAQPLSYSLIASWDRVAAYGLESRNGKMKISLSEGVVRAEPLDVPVSGGRLISLPAYDTRTEPPTLLFTQGVILENVNLSEEICRDWLLYVSPTLADATRADGQFSLSMNAGNLVIGQYEKASVGGVLRIQNGQVRPGPLAMQIVQQVEQIQLMLNRPNEPLAEKAFIQIPEEEIRFQLHEGRVYHENFAALIGGMQMTTAGSVGLDKTLAMKVNLYLPEKWLDPNRPVLKAIASEPIPFTVTGTTSDPKIDARATAEFGKNIGVKAGIGLIEKLIEKRQNKNR